MVEENKQIVVGESFAVNSIVSCAEYYFRAGLYTDVSNILHGATLAAILYGQREDEDDLRFLRNFADFLNFEKIRGVE